MPKPFNKTREHYHVPALLVLINLFTVILVYYVHGYSTQIILSGESIKGLLSGLSLFLALTSLFITSGSLIIITYIVSFLSIIYIF